MSQQNTIPSPYHFVPMAEEVFYPEWQDISQDYPVAEGVSGSISYELSNLSPLLVGEQSHKIDDINTTEFFKTPDKQYAIPGTSIKGMIRNWIEIVTHSKMSIINDTWLSYRDLHNKEYTQPLVSKGGSQAGWLRFEDGEWRLFPAKLTNVKSSEINDLFDSVVVREGTSARKIYENLNGLRKIGYSENKANDKTSAINLSLQPNESEKDGWLVVTGQIEPLASNRKGAKKINYIFSDPQSEPLTFKNKKVITAFLDIVQTEVERSRKKVEEKDKESVFNYLKGLKNENGVPVFYLKDEGEVSHIGMSKMFRFAYKHSIGELRHETHQKPSDSLDFSELLFGSINEENASKGRVSFSLARCQGSCKPIKLPLTTLGSPKSSFYPAYVDQSPSSENIGYNTYNQDKAKLAGFKRYGVHTDFKTSVLPSPMHKGKLNKSIALQLMPLPEKQVFKGKVRFHNLQPQELGAILYALNMTNEEGVYHLLGMGKPLGLGKVKFNLKGLSTDAKESVSIDEFIQSFNQYLEQDIQSLETLSLLRAMQNDSAFPDEELAYLSFTEGFNEVKQSEGEHRLPALNKIADRLEEEKTKRDQKLREQQIIMQKEADNVFSALREMLNEAKAQEKLQGHMVSKIAKELKSWRLEIKKGYSLSVIHQQTLKSIIEEADKLKKKDIERETKQLKKLILN